MKPWRRLRPQRPEIEPSELMAEYRPALTPAGTSGLEAEIFLDDTLPGGAGFASQVAHRGSELFDPDENMFLKTATPRAIAAYEASRTSSNMVSDPHVGAELLDYLISGDEPFNSRSRSLFHLFLGSWEHRVEPWCTEDRRRAPC